jgi:hypothetical protein
MDTKLQPKHFGVVDVNKRATLRFEVAIIGMGIVLHGTALPGVGTLNINERLLQGSRSAIRV